MSVTINFQKIDIEPPAKKTKSDGEKTDNWTKTEYWSVDHERFVHYIKDQLLVEQASHICGHLGNG